MTDPYKLAGDILSAASAPQGGFQSVALYGPAVQKQTKDAGCSVFHLENESGSGSIEMNPIC